MDILHTIYDDVRNPWCGGGGAVRALEVNRRLAARHRVTLVTGSYPGAPVEEEVHGIHVRRVGTGRSYALSRLSYSAMASVLLRRERFDVWVYDFSAFSPVHAPPALRARAVLLLHHLMAGHAARKYPGIGPVAAAVETLNTRLYRQIVAVSPSAAGQIKTRARPGARIATVHNGVDATCFVSSPCEADYILYFGRLDIYNKGLDILLDAFAQICEAHANVRLVLAGRGAPGRQRELAAMAAALGIAGRVEITGPVPDERRRELFAGALFKCLPSRYEGWGITAIEAGAAGKAVIGARIPGLVDAIRDGQTGLLVPPGSAEALAGAMRKLLLDPALRCRLGANGREWARRFTWDRVAQAQEAVYLRVLEQEGAVS